MEWFNNLKTALKILTSFLVICVILGVMGIYSIKNLISVRLVSNVGSLYQRMRVNIVDSLLHRPMLASSAEEAAELSNQTLCVWPRKAKRSFKPRSKGWMRFARR